MAKFGIGLVPERADEKISFGEDKNWADVLKYKNQIVDSRNSQLEYQQNVVELHTKIRQACKELTRKDYNIKENMEVLALERGRLGYLRDELARRAEELARRETSLRERALVGSPQGVSKESMRLGALARERDKENAFIVEMDVRRRSSTSKKEVVPSTVSIPSSPPPPKPCVREKVVERISPVVLSVADPLVIEEVPRNYPIEQFREINVFTAVSPTRSQEMSSPQAQLSDKETLTLQIPIFPPTSKQYALIATPIPAEDIRECLEGLWKEYSTVVDEVNGVRLMSLANFLRLCTDADFSVSTAGQIEMFLETVRTSPHSYSLVQRGFFLELLKTVFIRSSGVTIPETQLTNALFGEYLFPLQKRLQMQERQISSKHPSLPASSCIQR